MKHAVLISFIMVTALASCSKGKNAAAQQDIDYQKNESISIEKKTALEFLAIRTVAFSPAAPTVLDDVVVAPELVNGKAADIEYSYQWFVDGRQVADVSGGRLGKSRFKKGSWIYCRVQAASGSRQSAWYKSDIMRVLNSPPQLQLPPVSEFAVPGEFQYQAAASDPDDDPLTFALVSPLDQGIVFDPASGALSWPLSEAIVKALGGEKAEIMITVSDDDGVKAEGTITLNFTSARK